MCSIVIVTLNAAFEIEMISMEAVVDAHGDGNDN